jgi:4-diphosphocytidyl-2-C-methyl-D-erythritol kinase
MPVQYFSKIHNFTLYMLCFPNCKINLGLYVTRKREDGYHDLETVFYPVQVHDVLEIVDAKETMLHASGLPITGDAAGNLVLKAYELLRTAFPEKMQPADIFLHKVIPMGAGLGGGSADGAFMLRLLNDHFQLGVSDEELAAYALQLGSDCPFFVYNAPKFATGRGEQMSDVAIDLSKYGIQFVCPDMHVSTGKAFSMITPKAATYDLRELRSLPIEQWKDHITNDFELPVFKEHRVLAEIKKQLYKAGALYASMSGSGSAIYGIFEKGKRAEISVNGSFREFYAQ